MIHIPERTIETTNLFYDGCYVATVDYVQFLKIRVQIKELGIKGYTITQTEK